MYELTQREREILAVCGLEADLPAAVVAKRAGCSEQTVRVALRGLLDRKLIVQRSCIDISQLGLSSYQLLFSLQTNHMSERQTLLNRLESLPGVVWFAELDGDYNYVMTVCHGEIQLLLSRLDRIGDEFGEIFSKKAFAQQLLCWCYSHSLPTKERSAIELLGVSRSPVRSLLDELDHNLLKELARRPVTIRELCQKLGLAHSTLQYRVERLRRAGILRRAIFMLNHEALGYRDALLLVHANSSSKRLRDQLYDFCAHHPDITALVPAVGGWDYEISAVTREPDFLTMLRSDLMKRFPRQLGMISSFTLRRIMKCNAYPFATYEEYLSSIGADSAEQNARNDSAHLGLPRRGLAGNWE